MSESLSALFPNGIINKDNEKNILNQLNDLSNIKFAFELDDKQYFKLVEYFLISEAKGNHFENPGIILLMKSFISKLLLRPQQRFGDALKLMNRMEDNSALRLLKMSPPVILKSLYALLDNSPNHRVALKLLNQHPIAFVNMFLQQKPKNDNFSLFQAVTNPIALRLLARYLSPEEFLQYYQETDWSKCKIVATSTGDGYYKDIPDIQVQFFAIVSEPLIKAATLTGNLENLCLNCPTELKYFIQPAIVNLTSMYPPPPQFATLVPFISAISTRFSISLLGEISHPIYLLQAVKLAIGESPHLSHSIAYLISKKPVVWQFLPDNYNELIELHNSLQKYLPYMLEHHTDECISLLEKMRLTDSTAVMIINQLSLYLPKSFNAIVNCAQSGIMAFRLSAGIATRDNDSWIQFARRFRGRQSFIRSFYTVLSDFIISGKFLRALQLIDVLSTVYANNDKHILSNLCDFILEKFQSLPFNRIEHQILFIKVFGRVHKFADLIGPILNQWVLEDLTEKCLSLIIRFLWTATNHETSCFLEFRLRFLHYRIVNGMEPKPWTDEILKMSANL